MKVLACVGVLLALALHRPTSVSSSVEAMDWRQEKLTDGDVSYPGWSSAGGLDHADHAQDPEWVVVRLRTASKIDRVVLRPRNDPQWAGQGFPEDFTIAVSRDGKAWKTVVTKKGHPVPNGGEPQVFALGGVTGRFVKVEATRLRLAGNDYRFQLTEIEVY